MLEIQQTDELNELDEANASKDSDESYDFDVIWDRIAVLKSSIASRPILKEKILEHNVAFLFDTGSPANILDLETYQQILPDMPLNYVIFTATK